MISTSAESAGVSNLSVGDFSRESEVTILTEFGAPRVLNLPVLFNRVVTNEQDTVVDALSAGLQDSLSVELERRSIDTNSNRSLNNARNKVGAGSDSSVSRNGVGLRRRDLTSSIDSQVGISFFSSETVLNNVVQSEITETTTASLVFGVTVNELLLRETGELSISNEVSTFNTTSSSERPAATASTLVLRSSNGSLSNPIDIDISTQEF